MCVLPRWVAAGRDGQLFAFSFGGREIFARVEGERRFEVRTNEGTAMLNDCLAVSVLVRR